MIFKVGERYAAVLAVMLLAANPAMAQDKGGPPVVPTTQQQDFAALSKKCEATPVPPSEQGRPYAIKSAWFVRGSTTAPKKPDLVYACVQTDQPAPTRFAVFHSTWSPLAPSYYGGSITGLTCPQVSTVLCGSSGKRSFVVAMGFGRQCLPAVKDTTAFQFTCPLALADTRQAFVGLTVSTGAQSYEVGRYLRLLLPPVR